jgi:hypothetical protein
MCRLRHRQHARLDGEKRANTKCNVQTSRGAGNDDMSLLSIKELHDNDGEEDERNIGG